MRLLIIFLSISYCLAQTIEEINSTIDSICTTKKCVNDAKLLGNTFYLSADNYASESVMHPIYMSLFKKGHPTGVLFNMKTDISRSKIVKEIKKLNRTQKLPLFVGGDNCQSFYKGRSYRFKPEVGLNSCQTRVRAALAKSVGCNLIFNPQIEASVKTPFDSNFNEYLINQAIRDIKIYKKAGVLLTLKHFPITHQVIDNHNDVYDFKSPYLFMANNIFPVFRLFSQFDIPIMTTHLLNTYIDNKLTTFSKKWLDILRYDLGHDDHLILTDSITMIRSYNEAVLDLGFGYKWQSYGSHPTAVVVKSILAGHDIVLNRESSLYQAHMIKDLLTFLSSDHPHAEPFRERLKQIRRKIKKYKTKYKKLLGTIPNITNKDYSILMDAYLKVNELPESFCSSKVTQKIFKKIEIF